MKQIIDREAAANTDVYDTNADFAVHVAFEKRKKLSTIKTEIHRKLAITIDFIEWSPNNVINI